LAQSSSSLSLHKFDNAIDRTQTAVPWCDRETCRPLSKTASERGLFRRSAKANCYDLF
jgi:hypothetical protein